MSTESPPTGRDRPGRNWSLWTTDVDQVYADLSATGVRTLSAPHDFAGSLRAAWVSDPDGNPVQIVMRAAG